MAANTKIFQERPGNMRHDVEDEFTHLVGGLTLNWEASRPWQWRHTPVVWNNKPTHTREGLPFRKRAPGRGVLQRYVLQDSDRFV